MPSQVKITGTLKLSESLKPLSGLRIEIWDTTSSGYGWLAAATTNITGTFSLIINDPAASLIIATTLSIKYRIYKHNIFIVEGAIADYTLDLDVQVDSGAYDLLLVENPPPADAVSYITLWGAVTDSNNRPIDEAIINVYENGFREKNLIASTDTDVNGFYKISINTKEISNAVVIADRSIRIEATDTETTPTLLAASNNIFGWQNKPEIRIDLKSVTTNALTEFDKAVAAIRTVIGTSPDISSLTTDTETNTDEIKYVSGAIGQDTEFVKRMVQAHQHAEDSTLPADVVFALMNSDSKGRNPLFYMREHQIRSSIEGAIDKNQIQAYTSTEIDTYVEQIREYKATKTKETEFNGETYTLNDVFLSVFDTQTDIDGFLSSYHGDHETLDDFWDAYTTANGATATQKAQEGIQLATVCCFQPKILAEIVTEIDTNHISVIGGWDIEQWKGLISDVCTANTELCVPSNIRGEETDPGNTSIQEQYAEKMLQIAQASFPVGHIAAQLDGPDGSLLIAGSSDRANVLSFIGNNPEFDFISNNIHDIVEGGDFDLTGISDISALKSTLAPFQVMNRLVGRNPAAVCALMKDGVKSAAAIVKMGLENFVDTYGDYFPAVDGSFAEPHTGMQQGMASPRSGGPVSFSSTATTTYIGALVTASAATHTVVGTLTGMSGLGTAMVGGEPGLLAREIIPPYFRGGLSSSPSDDATLTALFGNQDYCTCTDCMSLYSPGAYLSDTLHFLKEYALDAYNGLIAKRPDIINTDLSCKNSNTLMPYIDLAIEQLELKILAQNPSDTIPTGLTMDTFSFQTTADSNELEAYPEHTYKDSEGDYQDYTSFDSGDQFNSIYDTTNLAGAIYPDSLPFNLAIEETRAYLSHFGVSRYGLMKLFKPFNPAASTTTAPTSSITDFSLYAEKLGLSQFETSIVTGSYSLCSSQPHLFYGATTSTTISVKDPVDPSLTITGNWLDVLSGRIDVLLQQTGITYSELLQYLSTDYLNADNETEPEISIVPLSSEYSNATCHLNELKLAFTSSPVRAIFFGKFHRFIRLVKSGKLNIYQWDMLLRSMMITDITQSNFHEIGKVLTIADDLNISPIVLSCWWNSIDTKQYLDYPNDSINKLPIFYSTIFNNKNVINKNDDDNAFEDPFSLPTAYVTSTVNHIQQIAVFCNVTLEEMRLLLEIAVLGAPEVTAITLPALSRVYVFASLARALKISIREMHYILHNLGITISDCRPNITIYSELLPSLQRLTLAVETVRKIMRSRFSIKDFSYLHSGISPIEQDPKKIQLFYENLRKTLAGDDIYDQTTSPADPERNEELFNKYSSIIYQHFGTEFGITPQVVADILANTGTINYLILKLIDGAFIHSTCSLSKENISELTLLGYVPGTPITGTYSDPSNESSVYPPLMLMEIYNWYSYFHRVAFIIKKLMLRPREFEYLFFNPNAVNFDFRVLLKDEMYSSSATGAILQARINNGGSGFSIGERIGFSPSGTGLAEFEVTDVADGVITAIRGVYSGSNHTVQTNAATYTLGLGLGTGATIDIERVYVPMTYYTATGAFFIQGLLQICRVMDIATRFDFDEDGIGRFLNACRAIPTPDIPGILPSPPIIKTSSYTPPLPILTTDPDYSPKMTAMLSEIFMLTQPDSELGLIDRGIIELIGDSIDSSGYTQTGMGGSGPQRSILNLRFSSNSTVSDFRPDVYECLSLFINVADILYWSGKIGANPVALKNILIEDITPSDSRTLINAMKSKYSNASWISIAKPLRDKVRIKQRDALVAYTRTTPNKLLGSMLIDLEMDPCMMTSRLKQVIGSVQLYIDRVILGLEYTNETVPRRIVLSRGVANQWDRWRKWYRVWQANREVFLFPENWMQPELRDDKSVFFEELETELKQDEVTAGRVEDAIKTYVQKIGEVARLEPVGTCDEVTIEGEVITHLFSRSYGASAKYYHRILKNDIWFPWERVDVDIQSDHILPCVWNNRLYLFWLTFKEKAAPFTPDMIAHDTDNGQFSSHKNNKWFVNQVGQFVGDGLASNAKNYKQLEITINWTEYKNGHWKNVQFGKENMLVKINPWIEWDLNNKIPVDNPEAAKIYRFLADNNQKSVMDFVKSRFSIYPYVYNPSTYDMVLTYKAVETGSTSSFAPVEKSSVLTPGDLYLMVLFPTSGSGIPGVAHDEFSNFIKSFQFSPGTNNPAITHNIMFNTMTVPGPGMFSKNMKHVYHAFPPLSTTPLTASDYSLQKHPYYSYSSYGTFIYDLNAGQALSVKFTTSPAPVWNKGYSDYNVYPQSGYDNPIEGKFIYEDRYNTFFVRPVSYTETTYNMYRVGIGGALTFVAELYGDPAFLAPGTVILPGPSRSVLRHFVQTLTHPHANDFLRVINYHGIDGLMRPDSLGMSTPPVVQTFPDTMNFLTNYDPVPNWIATGNADYPLPNNVVDFYYKGAYSCYNWELFFHIPMLIAQRLSENQQFAEARKWYHYIFDPTSNTYMGAGGSVSSQKFWKFKEFFDIAGRGIENLEQLLEHIRTEQSNAMHQVHESSTNPFNTFAIGRLRPLAFMKWVFMKYLDNLIAWGDMLFSRNTLESINEATQLYILASNLLGKKPNHAPQRLQPAIYSFREIASMVDEIGEASVTVESYTVPSTLGFLRFAGTDVAVDSTVATVATIVGPGPTGGSGTVVGGIAGGSASGVGIAGTSIVSAIGTSGSGTFAVGASSGTLVAGGLGTFSSSSAGATAGSLVAAGPMGAVSAAGIGLSGGPLTALPMSEPVRIGSTDTLPAVTDADSGSGHSGGGGPVGSSGTLPPTFAHVNYFCLKPNAKLFEYCDTVADRLFKIRHCQNMQGNVQQLPLFEPPINPALLVQAAAAGIDINSVLNDVSGINMPNYRFTYMVQKANEFCADVKALGGALLSALEKKDAEKLALLRQGQERNLLTAILSMKKLQVDEAATNLEALVKTRNNTIARYDYYHTREYMNPREKEALSSMKVAMGLQIASGVMQTTSAVLALIPKFHAQATFAVGASFGGQEIAASLSLLSGALSTAAAVKNAAGSMASTSGGYDRRMDEWIFQAKTAQREIEQIDIQIKAADIRKQVAENDYRNQELQIENSIAIDAFMRGKYTNEQLYDWTIAKISTTYFQAYQLANTMAKKAERCYKNELPMSSKAVSGFIKPGYWDSLKKGLLSGEALQLDIRTMEAAYINDNKRTLELTKHVSLAILDPMQLLQLKTVGTCTINIPEAYYDLDYPTHYNRVIKSISISIPCVAGPYTTIPCTLSHNFSEARRGAYLSLPKIEACNCPCNTIATSGAQNDAGVFDFTFRDERYLPFEGAGAACQLYLELGGLSNDGENLRPFDFDTISDVILHVKYTALDGAEDRSELVWGQIQDGIFPGPAGSDPESVPLQRIFSLKHEFPNAWTSYANTPTGTTPTLTIPLNPVQFPFFTNGKAITITDWHVRLNNNGGLSGSYDLNMHDGTAHMGVSTPSMNLTSTASYQGLLASTTFDPITDQLSLVFGNTSGNVNIADDVDDIFIVAIYTLS